MWDVEFPWASNRSQNKGCINFSAEYASCRTHHCAEPGYRVIPHRQKFTSNQVKITFRLLNRKQINWFVNLNMFILKSNYMHEKVETQKTAIANGNTGAFHWLVATTARHMGSEWKNESCEIRWFVCGCLRALSIQFSKLNILAGHSSEAIYGEFV